MRSFQSPVNIDIVLSHRFYLMNSICNTFDRFSSTFNGAKCEQVKCKKFFIIVIDFSWLNLTLPLMRTRNAYIWLVLKIVMSQGSLDFENCWGKRNEKSYMCRIHQNYFNVSLLGLFVHVQEARQSCNTITGITNSIAQSTNELNCCSVN